MLQIVFDDTRAIPEGVHAAIGVKRFGNLLLNRCPRVESMRALAQELGWPQLIHLCEGSYVSRLMYRLNQEEYDTAYLICPSHLFPACGDQELSTFLKQVEYAPSALYMPLNGSRNMGGWSLMRGPLLRKFLQKRQDGLLSAFFEEDGADLVDVPDRLRLIDLSDDRNLQDLLSGQLDARHFNTVERDNYTVLKRSKDRAKLKQEFDFYELTPPAFRMFLVQPFDFVDDGITASYRMERIGVPDMALQWVHDAFEPTEFQRFLDHIFHFISKRPARRTNKIEALNKFNFLYKEKVVERIATLKTLLDYEGLIPLFYGSFGGIDSLVDRYMSLLEIMRPQFPLERLVIGHGDPCFSNILYSKSGQFLKMIDPRGASRKEDLYTDPYYDVAKLSHSILGDYDLLNHNSFDISVDERLRLKLAIKHVPRPWAAELFRRTLDHAGFDLRLTRICEASLFISMLPLHIDRPQKVLAFALRASSILDELELLKDGFV